MKPTFFIRAGLIVAAVMVLALRSASVQSDTVFFAGSPPEISQVPLYIRDTVPPLNMLVMGKDHKIYYEAYNDASDLDGDGLVDVGYRGWERKSVVPDDGSSPFKIDYYGYFDSFMCYDWDGNKFVPGNRSEEKTCNGRWSGDFLNYATMSRMDVLRRVLYGGWRQSDTAGETVLQGAFFPQDAHSWGKEYQSIERDGYDIRRYTPLPLPNANRYHLFAITTFSGNEASFPNYHAPRFRVLRNTTARVWEWVAKEGPVAGSRCVNNSTWCEGGSTTSHPGHPANRAGFDNLETTWGTQGNLLAVDNPPNINCGSNCGANGQHDNYMTIITGELHTGNQNRRYQFAVDGDDAVDFVITHPDGSPIAGGEAGKYGAGARCNCNSNRTGEILLSANSVFLIKFRHEEAGGGDSYTLSMRQRSNSNTNWGSWEVVSTPSGNTAGLRNLTRSWYTLVTATGAAFDPDRFVRVQACPGTDTTLHDPSCKAYPTGVYKPTGILHEYGEQQRMYFGLITGTQRNNLQGGVLRRNIHNFADEIDASTGVFRSDVEGIVRSIDRLRMIGGGYDGGGDNISANKNWNWANVSVNTALGGRCVSQGSRTLDNGECRMWGNPIAEMMFEAVRYFAGAVSPTSAFTVGPQQEGIREDNHLGLPEPGWKDPYVSVENGGGGYASCSRPVMTVISDINPSYDGDLPGSAFVSGITDSTLSGFHAADIGQEIWNQEFSGTQNVFIGEAGGLFDGAPTAKPASSFGNIRGLAPEEPTKEGTYYSASVARYGATTRINSASNAPNLTTYSIALASPLPRMSIPVGGRTVELLPFAKTVSGTFGEGARKPTNTIVDFFVESIVNFPGQPIDSTVNQGRPHAVFRINYEDVEQGNDHDMDAIVRYEISAGTNTLTVRLTSEYAAGSANQNIGYVISGTTRDGVYLEVRDIDNTNRASSAYELNTPPNRWAGGCVGQMSSAPCNQGLDLNATREFQIGTEGAGVQLRDPLWYAAKYGSPGGIQVDDDGEPQNYFLVSNPLNLRAQLSKAFDSAESASPDAGSAAISGARIGAASFTLAPSYRRDREAKDWTGNLTAISFNTDGTLGSNLWNAQAGIPPHAARGSNIFTIHTLNAGTYGTRVTGRLRDLPGSNEDRLARLGINHAQVATRYGDNYNADDFIAYLEGDQSNEEGRGGTLRNRSHVLGAIINSEPVIASPRSNYGYSLFQNSMFSGYDEYLEEKRDAGNTTVYVGANDGMLHAFNANTEPCASGNAQACAAPGAGSELFGYIPHALLPNLGELALPDDLYNHRYYVDGQIAVSDAKDGSTWKTLLAGTTGAGGRSLFVLDVSNPHSFDASDVLWERNNSLDLDIGHTFGKPLIVPLENGSWGVLVGNGYGGNNSDPSLYILDAFTGTLIRKITANDGNPATEPGVPAGSWACQIFGGLMPSLCAQNTDPYNGMAQITAIDKDGDGRVDTVYGGDLEGNLWKFDISGSSTSAWNVANSGSPLFVAERGGSRQPITGGIRVAAGPGTGVMVYFGTGRYLFTVDNTVPADPDIQSIYGIFDNGTAVVGGRNALAQQSITAQSTSASGELVRNLSRSMVSYFGDDARRGWYIDLAVDVGSSGVPNLRGEGERFIGTPLIQSGRVFFTTYTPMEDSCNPGGLNFIYGLDLLSGAGALGGLGTLPGGDPVCTGPECGAVSIDNENGGGNPDDPNRTRSPVTSINPGNINRVEEIVEPGCTPGVDCPTYEECAVVIYPGAFVLPRPCGRQSWRQLK